MADTEKRILLCDCEGSASVSEDGLLAVCARFGDAKLHSSLCRKQTGAVVAALNAGGAVIACAQEAPRFEEIAEELEAGDRLLAVDIRDRALWSDQGEAAAPKAAALLAEALRPARPVGAVDLESEGVCLVYGAAAVALPAARKLADRLVVTCMISDDGAAADWAGEFPLFRGRIAGLTGHMGDFQVTADAAAEAIPGGRGAVRFDEARDGGRSACDIVLDLSGGAALLAAHAKRDGYLRADPADPLAISEALFEASALIGTFEKPLYVDFHAQLCAHSRSGQPGCTRCLDVCPTGAITPDGETVTIDPYVCAGCGACSAVCPSGAADYALPRGDDARMRLEAMLTAYAEAGGAAPRILIHDESGGRAVIAAAARFGQGLPADVIPFAVNEIPQVAHDLVLGALAMGAGQVFVHQPERLRREGEAEALEAQASLSHALMAGAGLGPERFMLIETDDPDVLTEALYEEAPGALSHEPVSPLGDRRAALRLSMGALTEEGAAPFALPEGAPYGQVVLDVGACTLCLACVSQCPAGALMDGQDKPQLGFREDACLQCGVCVNTCPESALKLEPRYNPAREAREKRVLHEEEPFECVECGKPFGSRGAVERILEKLGGKHWMYQNPDRARIIQMCDDCRVGAVFKVSDNPFAMGERPRVRTTADYEAGRLNGDEDDA